MKRALIFVFICSVLSAQDFGFSPHDCALNASGVPTATLPCSVPYSDASMPYPSLRYGYGGAVLNYNFSFPDGPAFLTLSFSEPNKTATNQRLFTYKVNNQPPVQIDVFKLSGGQKKKLDIVVPVVITSNSLTIQLTAQVGNAIINGIQLLQIVNPIVKWMQCTVNVPCASLNYLKLMKTDSTFAEFYAIPVDANFNAADFLTQIQ